MTRARIAAAAVALALPTIMAFEGLVLRPYRDPVNLLTVCYGETHAEMRTYTPAECRELLEASAQKHATQIEPCLPDGLPEHVYAATISFAYNVGAQAFCQSTFARKLRNGDPGACAELSRWVYAGGRILPGLVRRRAAERAMCEGSHVH